MAKHRKHDKRFYRTLASIALPVTFQSFMHAAVSAGDSAMLGFVSQDALAAVSLATQVQFVFLMLQGVFLGGGTVLTAQYWGDKDRASTERIFCLILRYSAALSAVFFLAAALVPEYLMRIFAVDAELIKIGGEYLRISSGSFLFSGVSQCCLAVMKTTGRAKKSAVIGSTALALDTVLNFIFIFGLFGLPAMGAKGAALTTVVARGVELALVLLDWRKAEAIRPSVKGLMTFSRAQTKEFWRYALPMLLNSLVWGGGMTVFSVVIGRLGSDAAAANSIANVVKNLISCLCDGIGTGGGIMLGNILGANKLRRAKVYGGRLSRMSVVCGLICALLVLMCGPLISSFMRLTDTAREYLNFMLIVCAVYMFAKSINVTVVCGIFEAGGDTAFDAYSVFVSMWLFGIPLAIAAAFWWKLPVEIVYLFVSIDEIIKLPWVYAHYKKYKWVKNITRKDV